MAEPKRKLLESVAKMSKLIAAAKELVKEAEAGPKAGVKK